MAREPHGVVLECDELWSFVRKRQNQQWIWLAMDRLTRRIVGVHVGDRTERSAQALGVHPGAVSDLGSGVHGFPGCLCMHHSQTPASSQCQVPKEPQTNHIEWFGCTLRQRISRLVRKSLTFSKKQENHLGALWNFIHHYNATMCV